MFQNDGQVTDDKLSSTGGRIEARVRKNDVVETVETPATLTSR